MAFEFDRYINGKLMAEGVIIERQKNLADAMREAARIASRGPNGEMPVLVLRALAERAGGVKTTSEETLAQEFSRLIREYHEPDTDGTQGEAWNLIADFAVENADAILSALTTEPAAPEGRQETWQHISGCGEDRESKMVFVSDGVFCDPCIAPLVAALNAGGIVTVASCCGHDHHPGSIALRDGRCLVIAKDFDEWSKIDAMFPTDINGDARPAEQAVTEAMVRAAAEILLGRVNAPEQEIYGAARAALKAAMESGG